MQSPCLVFLTLCLLFYFVEGGKICGPNEVIVLCSLNSNNVACVNQASRSNTPTMVGANRIQIFLETFGKVTDGRRCTVSRECMTRLGDFGDCITNDDAIHGICIYEPEALPGRRDPVQEMSQFMRGMYSGAGSVVGSQVTGYIKDNVTKRIRDMAPALVQAGLAAVRSADQDEVDDHSVEVNSADAVAAIAGKFHGRQGRTFHVFSNPDDNVACVNTAVGSNLDLSRNSNEPDYYYFSVATEKCMYDDECPKDYRCWHCRYPDESRRLATGRCLKHNGLTQSDQAIKDRQNKVYSDARAGMGYINSMDQSDKDGNVDDEDVASLNSVAMRRSTHRPTLPRLEKPRRGMLYFVGNKRRIGSSSNIACANSACDNDDELADDELASVEYLFQTKKECFDATQCTEFGLKGWCLTRYPKPTKQGDIIPVGFCAYNRADQSEKFQQFKASIYQPDRTNV